jgi:hypothetical protein
MLFSTGKKERIITVVEKGDRPYMDLDDIPVFDRNYVPTGIERRYAAGVCSLVQSSATEVELTFKGAAWDDTPYDDWSRFFGVWVHTGTSYDAPSGGKRNRNNGRDAELWCGLEVHRTVGGKFEWGLYGPLEVCVSSRSDDTFTNFWVADPADDTLRAIGAVVTRHLYGQLMSA